MEIIGQFWRFLSPFGAKSTRVPTSSGNPSPYYQVTHYHYQSIAYRFISCWLSMLFMSLKCALH